MEPEEVPKEKKQRFQIELLEERIAPAHVVLPASPGHLRGDADGPSAAPSNNAHFSGTFKPLPWAIPIVDVLRS